MKGHILIAALLLPVSFTPAGGQTLAIETTASSITHEWGGSFTNGYLAMNPGDSPIPSFTASLSDYTAIRYTIAAPDGMKFRFVIPEDANSVSLNYSIQWTTGVNLDAETVSVAAVYSFENFSGPEPSFIQTSFIFQGGGSSLMIGNGIRWASEPGAVVEFSSVSIDGDISLVSGAGLPEYTYTAAPSGIYAKLYIAYIPSPASDPGSPIAVASSVPEPSTYALIAGAAALLAMVWRGRRAP